MMIEGIGFFFLIFTMEFWSWGEILFLFVSENFYSFDDLNFVLYFYYIKFCKFIILKSF